MTAERGYSDRAIFRRALTEARPFWGHIFGIGAICLLAPDAAATTGGWIFVALAGATLALAVRGAAFEASWAMGELASAVAAMAEEDGSMAEEDGSPADELEAG